MEQLKEYNDELKERVSENENARAQLQLQIIEITSRITQDPSQATEIIDYVESEESEEEEKVTPQPSP